MALSTLVFGGARSGKSRFAEQLVQHTAAERVCYIATGQALDGEMAQRIALHQQQRPSDWHLCEEPLQLVAAIQQQAQQHDVLLVDCLTLWLNNMMYRGDSDLKIKQQVAELGEAIVTSSAQVVLVSNEVGQGVVSDNALVRRFVDQSGWMNQALASKVQRVALISAGLPLWLKGAAL